MPPTGNLANLAERMKEKTEQNRQQIEKIVEGELTKLQQHLSNATKNALSIIKKDMEREIQNARETFNCQTKMLNLNFAQRWLTTAVMALAVTIGMVLGSWSLVKLMERKALNLYQEISQLRQQRIQLETTAQQLQAKTWDLDLLETPDGRYIILPPKATAKTGYTHNKNRQAIKVE